MKAADGVDGPPGERTVSLPYEEYRQLVANRRQLGSLAAKVRALRHHVDRLDGVLDEIERRTGELRTCDGCPRPDCGDVPGRPCGWDAVRQILEGRPRM
jgi:hypothetical protein